MMESLNEKIERLVFTLTYNNLLDIEQELLRTICLKRYEEEKENIINMFPSLEDYFDDYRSLEYNYYNLEQIYNESISGHLFPGDQVRYYPIVEEFKAKVKHTCAISGAIINPGSYYEQFKAILNNVSQHKSFVSTKIRYERGSDFRVPASLHEFEDFCYRLERSYDFGLAEEYNIFCNIGGMQLQRIRYKNQKPKKRVTNIK